MTTINKKILTLSLILSLGISFSCEDDLDVPLKNVQNEVDFLSNPANAVSLVNGVYSKNLDWNMYSFSWLGVASIASDEADKGSSPGDTGTDKHQFDDLNINPAMLSLSEVWNGRYEGVYHANNALFYLPQLKIEDDLRNRLIGEVKFLRALWYFDLVRCFGGVPIVSEKIDINNIELVNQVVFTRKSQEETYAFIESELLDAISKLPNKTQYAGTDLGRATKGAAQALLAKVYLYQEKWNDAFNMSGNVISSGEYALMSDYADVWKEIGENGVESIFEVQATLDSGLDNWAWVQGGRGTPDYGWGFNTPSLSLFNSYEANDKRKDATILISGQTLWDGFVTPSTWNNPRYNYKAYHSRTKEQWNGNNGRQPKNLRLLKFSEQLLIRAEAAFRLGNSGEALNQINKLRTRAGLTPLSSITLQNIYNERRAEMAMENDRWFDIIRTGQAQSVMAADGKSFINGKHNLYPIPEIEIMRSRGRIKQNSGY